MSPEFAALSFEEQTLWLRAETLRRFAAWMRGEGDYPCGSIGLAREWLPEYEGKLMRTTRDYIATDLYGNP